MRRTVYRNGDTIFALTIGCSVSICRASAPAPVLALTATATPLVQKDIATQLGLIEPTHFIHGFRRENIGIEIVEALPSRLCLAKIMNHS